MNICVTVNSNYEKYLYVMLTSLYEANRRGSIRLYVLQRDFTDVDKEDIGELTEKYDNAVTFIDVDPHKFDNMPMSQKGRNNLTLEIYFRLLIPEYLPKDLDRVLMLDVDIVVLKNLEDVYMTDFKGKYLAAAPNMCHNGLIPEGWRRWYQSDRTNQTHYNTGVLLWNLESIREDFPREYIFQQAWEHPIDIATFEEELFNVVFGENGILEIPAEKYNYICTHEAVVSSPKFYVYQSNSDIRENCSIVHYAALNPWQGGEKNDKFQIWWEICKKTKYYQTILEISYEKSERYLIQYKRQVKEEFDRVASDYEHKLWLEREKLRYIGLLLEEENAQVICAKLKKALLCRVAIYGASKIAKILSGIFESHGIKTVCYIDKYYHGKFSGKNCLDLSELEKNKSDMDCIVISNAYYYDEITRDLKKYSDLPRVTIDELLK